MIKRLIGSKTVNNISFKEFIELKSGKKSFTNRNKKRESFIDKPGVNVEFRRRRVGYGNL